ncbi:keratin, type I cytoskeletal 50 kDa-like [Polymixia lowei]
MAPPSIYGSSPLQNSIMSPMSSAGSLRLSKKVGYASSVYGGAGCSGVRFSRAFNLNIVTDVTDNEKLTMQNLNGRLATYVDKVHNLQKANTNLELKIRQFLENKTKPECHDFLSFRAKIKTLQEQIYKIARGNSGLYLSIDNKKVDVDESKAKYENELYMRQSEEADIAELKKLLGVLNLRRSDLQLQIDGLKQELDQVKKNHNEDMAALYALKGGQMTVEVNAAPQPDLSTIIDETRHHYEQVTTKNHKDLEAWFLAKTTELNKEVTVNTETLQSSKSEVTEFRRILQTLTIDIEFQLSMKQSLENSLIETQSRFGNVMAGYQTQVINLEDQLAHIRTDLENKKVDQARLEAEIIEYSRLLHKDNDR